MRRYDLLGLMAGLLLIGLGFLFFILQFIPGVGSIVRLDVFWPLFIVGAGALFLLAAVVAHTPALAIPGCIVGGIGVLLFLQNLTGYWESWAYAWTLIPGFVGIGLLLSGMLAGDQNQWRPGTILIVLSAGMFIVFAAFLGPLVFLRRLWPLLLVLVGLGLIARTLFVRQV